MDKYEPTIEDILNEKYYYYYKEMLDKKITFEDWCEIKATIWRIKDLLKIFKEVIEEATKK